MAKCEMKTKKWDVLMKVEGWVKIGEVEGSDRNQAEVNVKLSDDLDENSAYPFESHLVDLLNREGSLEVEEQ